MVIIVVAAFLALAALLAVEGFAVMLLWNYLAPAIIPLSDVSFWQALALVLLSSFLFGNIGRAASTGAKGSGKST